MNRCQLQQSFDPASTQPPTKRKKMHTQKTKHCHTKVTCTIYLPFQMSPDQALSTVQNVMDQPFHHLCPMCHFQFRFLYLYHRHAAYQINKHNKSLISNEICLSNVVHEFIWALIMYSSSKTANKWPQFYHIILINQLPKVKEMFVNETRVC